MTVTRLGIVATEQPLASQIGAQILARGGHAVDAAVAANAALGLTAPMMCGMGGDLFAIVYEAKTGKLYGLNASGWAPAALTPDFLRAQGFTNMPQRGIHAVTVPGCVAGWQMLLDRFGRKKFAEVLAPTIRLAEEGFPVTEMISQFWPSATNTFRSNPAGLALYAPNGHTPRLGEIFRNPDLAWSYRQLAARGSRAFYEGSIARRILGVSQAQGGTMTSADLRSFAAEWCTPISTTYRGWTVYEIPPNGQGIAALMMLNLMEGFPLGTWGFASPQSLHVEIEAKKLAYSDMLRYVADQRFAETPIRGLLSKSYAEQRARLMDVEQANAHVEFGKPFGVGTDTTYFCACDEEGNMISIIQSNYSGFGCGLVVEGAGFALHNRGGLFSLDPTHPNYLAGRKRPLHTIIPGFMEKGDTRIAFGIMGGFNQAQAHAQFVANIADYGMNVQQALEAPRFTKSTFTGNDVSIESRVSEATRAALSAKGHQLTVRGPFSSAMGSGQAILRDFRTRVNFGATDPRNDGLAIPQPVRAR